MYVYLSIYCNISTDVYARIWDFYTYIYCIYTSEYVSYTVMQYMIRTLTYMYVYVCICLPMSSIWPWLLQYMHVFQVYTCIYHQWDGGTHVSICQYMHVYMSKIHAYTSVRICTYIQQYFCMYFQQYICPYFCMYIQQYFLHSVTVPSRLLRIRRRRRAVAAPSPRGRYGKFVARQRTAHRKIQSDLVCATEQRQPAATCRGARWSVTARWSAMAILVGGRSRGNSGAATSQWRWKDEKFIESTTADEKAISDFLEPTAHRNSSTKNQRTRLQSYWNNLRMSRHCCKSILQRKRRLMPYAESTEAKNRNSRQRS